MAELTTKQRKRIPEGKFGVYRKGEGKYPITDRVHAANAKARASQQYNAGNLSAADKAAIDAKANKVLNSKK